MIIWCVCEREIFICIFCFILLAPIINQSLLLYDIIFSWQMKRCNDSSFNGYCLRANSLNTSETRGKSGKILYVGEDGELVCCSPSSIIGVHPYIIHVHSTIRMRLSSLRTCVLWCLSIPLQTIKFQHLFRSRIVIYIYIHQMEPCVFYISHNMIVG